MVTEFQKVNILKTRTDNPKPHIIIRMGMGRPAASILTIQHPKARRKKVILRME
ncbi:hypothetical protein DXG01_008632 [Tephrocybe rancida]|nr:hypothetical protein DXG01_008632 [Tephrocybe rancida]